MPIYNEVFETYRQEVKDIDKAITLLVKHDYKVIDRENQLIHKGNLNKQDNE